MQTNSCDFMMKAAPGYVFHADEVIALDPINPTTAAR
jgi:uncharacterized protein DUF3458